MECWDPFQFADAAARAAWYGISGIPDVRIDGKYSVLGAAACGSAYNAYRQYLLQRQAETGGVSPLEITGSYAVASGTISMQAAVRLVDPVVLTDLRATLVAYEDSVYATGAGYFDDEWQHSARAIRDVPIALSGQGDEVTVTASAPFDPSWVPAHTRVVAFVQRTTGDREIYQAAFLEEAYLVTMASHVTSFPQGNGIATYEATIENRGSEPAVFTLEPGVGILPEAGFGNWLQEFTDCGGGAYQTEPLDVTLDPGQTCAVSYRVHTDDAYAKRSGGLRVTSRGLPVETLARIFNGGPAVLLADMRDYPAVLPRLTEMDVLFDHWENPIGWPELADLAGYDVLIWDAGYYGLLVPPESVIAGFMDQGGSYFQAGQRFLDMHPSGAFLRNYLGIDSYLLEARYTSVAGLPGDPIGSGLNLPLTFPAANWNHDDAMAATSDAVPFLVDGLGRAAGIRHVTEWGAKSVFVAFPFITVSEDDAVPNNQETVLARILDWLSPSLTSGTEPAIEPPGAVTLSPPHPNPFDTRVAISFTLTPRAAAGPVLLEVFDPAGRLVARREEESPAAGTRAWTWDGKTKGGIPAANGVYFVRLVTMDGTPTQPVILLRR